MRLLFPSLALAVALGVHGTAALAAPPANDARGGPVVVIVKVPTPWYAPRWLVERKMRQALPQYRQVPGLSFKIFSFARPEGEFGGIYLWQDRARAQAWFGPAWYARVRDERGVEPEVRMFDANGLFDRTSDETLEKVEGAVATLTTVAKRDGDARALVDPHTPGLLRGYAIDAGKGRRGEVLLWRSESAATRALDAAWQRRQQAVHGSAPAIEWFDAPILLPSALPANRAAERAMMAAGAR
jgi:Putative mono-oxygenase ydhR